MKSPYDWRQVRRFSIRKLTIGVVSATIGLAIIGLASHSDPVLADQSTTQQEQKVTITYDYVAYEDLTPEQKAALNASENFPKETAQGASNYILVYQKDKGVVGLPQTSDSLELGSLLAGLGVLGVLVAVSRRQKKLVAKVLVVTALSGAALTAADSRALEAGLRTFLTESHLVSLGDQLPQPEATIGDRHFRYYLKSAPAALNTIETSKPQEEKGSSTSAETKPEFPVVQVPVTQNGGSDTTEEKPEFPVDQVPVTQNGGSDTTEEKPEFPVDQVPVTQNGGSDTTEEKPEFPVDQVPVTQNGGSDTTEEKPEFPVDQVPVTQNGGSDTTEEKPEFPVDQVPVTQNGGSDTTEEKPEFPVDQVPVTQNGGSDTTEEKPEFPVDDVPVSDKIDSDTIEPLPTFDPEADADGDGFSNQDELTAGSNPLDAQSVPETSSQPEEGEATNSTEPLPTFDPEADADGDGFSNQDELTAGSNPMDENSVPEQKTTPEEDDLLNTTEALPEFPMDQVVTEVVNFSITSTDDDQLLKGQIVIDIPGITGSVTYIILDGERHILAETPAKTQVQRVGTKVQTQENPENTQPETPETGEQPQPEKTETETTTQPETPETGEQPQPETSETDEQPQPEKPETETSTQPETSETGEQPQPEKTETETTTQPETSETGEQPQPEKTETETTTQPEIPETGEQPQPEKTETETTTQPETSETGEQPQPEKTETETTTQPEKTETGEQPQPEKPETETTTQPETSETGEQPQPEKTETETTTQPETSETGEQPQPEKPETETTTQPETSETSEQPQPEKPETETTTQPETPETGEQPQPEKPETETTTQPETSETGEQPQPETSETGEQPQPEKPETETTTQPETPETGEQPPTEPEKKPTQADTTQPQAVKQTVKLNQPVLAENSINTAALPADTRVEWAENGQPSSAQPGTDIRGKVLVTYSDQSSENVDVTIDVTATLAEVTEPQAVKQTVKLNQPVLAENSINTAALPADTRVEWAENGQPSSAQPGTDIRGKVRVTYSDQSSENVDVTIDVTATLAEVTEPQAVKQTVKLNQPVLAENSINTAALPADTRVEWAEDGQPSSAQPGTDIRGKVLVTYSDQSSENVDVTIDVTATLADLSNPRALTQTVKRNQPVQPQASIDSTSAQDMTGFAWKNGQPDTSLANDNLQAVVTVTYRDGSADEVTVAIIVQAWQAELTDPKPVKQVLMVGDVPQASASISPENLPEDTTINWAENGKPSTEQAGLGVAGRVMVTYKDGSSETVDVTIDVKAQPLKDTHQPTAKKQSVSLGASVAAANSVTIADQSVVKTIDWLNQQAPSTNQPGQDIPAKVRVTYTDDSFDDVDVTIDVTAPTEFYVRNGNYNSLAGQGTQEAPFDSLKRALELATDGVTIKLVENVQGISVANTASANTFAINKAVTIDGQGNSLSFRGLNLETLANVTFKDLTLDILPDGAQNDSIIRTNGNQVIFNNVRTTLNNRSSNHPVLDVNGGQVTLTNSTEGTEFKAIKLAGQNASLNLDSQARVKEGVTASGTGATITSTSPHVLAYRGTSGQNTTLNLQNVSPNSSLTLTGLDHLNLTNSQVTPASGLTALKSLTLTGTADRPANLNLSRLVGEFDDEVTVTIDRLSADNGQIQLPLNTKLVVTEPITTPVAIIVNDQPVTRLTPLHVGHVLVTVNDQQVTDNLVFTLYPENSGYRIARQGNNFVIKGSDAVYQNPEGIDRTVVVGSQLDPADSIDQEGLENVRGYAWKEGEKPSTDQADIEIPGIVIVTYTDGSSEEVDVYVTVQSMRDFYTPTAKPQTVTAGEQVSPQASIEPSSIANLQDVESYAWKNGQPNTEQPNPNLKATVLVTYKDKTQDEVEATIIVNPKPMKDVYAPTAKPQTVTVGNPVSPQDSIEPSSIANLQDVQGYAWKNGQPNTSQVNQDLKATVIVTYTDQTTDEVEATIIVKAKPMNDVNNPTAQTQTVKVGDTLDPRASIVADSAQNMKAFAWKDPEPSTAQANNNLQATVIVTYDDDTTDEVNVTIVVQERENLAQRTNPTPVKQRVATGTDLTNLASASISPEGLPTGSNITWLTQPSTTEPGSNKAGKVRVTYSDNSADEVDVQVDVVAKPTLTLTKLVDDDETQTATLTYRLEDPSSTYTSAKVRLLKGTDLVQELPLGQWQSGQQELTLNNLEHNVEYTVETILTYDLGLGQGQQDEPLTDRRQFELTTKKVEFRNVAENELYTVDAAGQLTRVNGLTTAPNQTDLANYVVKIRTSKNKDVYLPVASITDSGDGFTVTATQPELVQFGSDNTTKTEGYSFKLGKIVTKPGAYSDFSELIKAMNNNPTGTYYLSADMQATASPDGSPYVKVPFTGSLSSVDDSKRFAIEGLTGPLFTTLNGATISNIALKNVNINNTALKRVGALANTTTGNTTIKNIELQGSINAESYVGGLIFNAGAGARLENITTDMTISNTLGFETHQVGGVVGLLEGSLSNVSAKTNITSRVGTGSAVGGLVGQVRGNLSNAYVAGNVTATSPNARAQFYVGGAVGQGFLNFWTGDQAKADQLISAVTVASGNSLVGNAQGGLFTNLSTVTGQSTGVNYNGATAISPEEATTRTATWKATPVQATTTTPAAGTTAPSATATTFDWSSLTKAKPGYETAYENMEKLLPYYDRHTIVKYANKLRTDSKLFTTKLLSAVPMTDTRFAADTLANATINKLFLHFEGNTKEEYDLTALGNFKTTKIREFSFGDGLLYTPEQFNQVPETLVNDLVAELINVPTLTRDHLISLLAIQDENRNGLVINKNTLANRLLYLNKPLEQVKAQLTDHVKALISSYASIDLESQALARYLKHDITKDKQILMLALAHLERSYNVNYDAYNIKNLVTYRPDFDGKKVDLLSYLTGFAKDEPTLRLTNNFKTYADQIKGVATDRADLIDFLEHRRALFLPGTSNDDWFKNNTKAFVYEKEPAQVETTTHRLYSKLKDHEEIGALSLKLEKAYQRFILPLLNLTKEDQIFVLSDMSTLTFGHFGQVVDPALATSNPELFAAKIKEAKEGLIPNYMTEVGNYLELWYRLAKDDKKQVLLDKQIRIRQGYNILDSNGNKRWVAEHGDSFGIVDDFYGPMELYYERVNQVSARARDTAPDIEFHGSDLLTNSDTTTHELVHQYDNDIMLHGYGMRLGQDKESYAKGLFESAAGLNDYYYGFNFAYNLPNANHNSTPDRFKTTADLQHYMKGVFDVTYSLDLLELEAIRRQGSADQHLFFQKLDAVSAQPTSHNNMTYTHAYDRLKPITQTDWATVGTATVDNLIANNLVLKDPIYTIPDTGRVYAEVQDDNYNVSYLTAPIYGGNVNANGTSRGIQFRRTALELLASKGWEDGFLPYATNKWLTEAETAGQVLSDQYILNRVLNGQSYADFKKAEYATRQAKLEQLKGITINYNGNRVVTTTDDLRALFEEATRQDLDNLKRGRPAQQRHLLKLAIIKAYNQATKDFRESIYKP